jgi:hypothetical protein
LPWQRWLLNEMRWVILAQRYTAYVDISAKIEQWHLPSAVAVSNGSGWALWVSPEIKQRLRARIVSAPPPQYEIMAILAFLALRPRLTQISRIVLDADYSGDTAQRIVIRNLVDLIRGDLPTFKAAHIRMAMVAQTRADILARQVFGGKTQPNHIVSWSEVEALLRQ